MIEFVTVLAGLLLGPQTIQLQAGPEVAAVEFFVDGTLTERKEAPPWVFQIDLGEGFLPHRLEARAYSAEGAETGKASRFVNFGHRTLDGRWVLEVPETGLAREGRLLWPKVEERQLEYVEIRLDGQPVETTLDGRFELPEYDPEVIHYLAGEVLYQGDLEVSAEAIFGAERGPALSTELTAVPVALEAGAELPSAAEMTGWLTAGGEPLPVVSTHTAGAQLAIVRDTHFDATVDILVRKKRERFYAQPGKILDEHDRVVFQMTHELVRDPRGVFRSVPILPEFYKGGLWHLLAKYAPRTGEPVPQHLWTTTLLAGRRISDVHRPRAVLLVLSKRPKDDSGMSFQVARDYLAAIRAPLYVWAPESETFERLGIELEPRFYVGPEGMASLFEDLGADLAQQRTLWVEGRYAPGEMALGPSANGIRLLP